MEHGTNSGYTNAKCRCVDCRRAHADWQREYDMRRRATDPAWAARRREMNRASDRRRRERDRTVVSENESPPASGSSGGQTD